MTKKKEIYSTSGISARKYKNTVSVATSVFQIKIFALLSSEKEVKNLNDMKVQTKSPVFTATSFCSLKKSNAYLS